VTNPNPQANPQAFVPFEIWSLGVEAYLEIGGWIFNLASIFVMPICRSAKFPAENEIDPVSGDVVVD
jgi:hypothetical protein